MRKIARLQALACLTVVGLGTSVSAMAGHWSGGTAFATVTKLYPCAQERPNWDEVRAKLDGKAAIRCHGDYATRISAVHGQLEPTDCREMCRAVASATYGCGDYVSDY